jgi:hypothetical protein
MTFTYFGTPSPVKGDFILLSEILPQDLNKLPLKWNCRVKL